MKLPSLFTGKPNLTGLAEVAQLVRDIETMTELRNNLTEAYLPKLVAKKEAENYDRMIDSAQRVVIFLTEQY